MFAGLLLKTFFIGSPEAESEATITPITLDQFFEDYLDILTQLAAFSSHGMLNS